MSEMKSLCLVLLVAFAMPACSRFTSSGRMDRAYYKQLKEVKVAREKRRKQLIQHQRAETPGLRSTTPPLEQQNVQVTPES